MKNSNSWLIWLGLAVLFLASHLVGLTKLPVFADEAIYIRWSQLIIDDWRQYLFFSLNDGKTPFQIWLMAPLQLLFSNQLVAGRMVSVLTGLGQMLAIGYLIKLLGGKTKTVITGMVMTMVLPFWYFHHRMALLDAMMTLWLTVALIGVVRVTQLVDVDRFANLKWQDLPAAAKSWLKSRRAWWVVVIAAGFGLALLSKLPAALLLPAFFLFVWLPEKSSLPSRALMAGLTALGLTGGLAMFGLLKLNPAFGQLFNRGSDFLHPFGDVLFGGVWLQTLANTPTYVSYMAAYLTVPLVALNVASLFFPKGKRLFHVLFWSAVVFALPIALFGRVVYPRYFLPVSVFLTAGGALALQSALASVSQLNTRPWLKTSLLVGIVLIAANIFGSSGQFVTQHLVEPDQTAFVSADKVQYLYEWSSGHGIRQTTSLIQSLAQDHSVAVATEGFFGTLPDGILLYLHQQDVSNIFVEGIGQPVRAIPDSFTQRAAGFDQTLLVVNSHRLNLVLPRQSLIAEYCRPDHAPCLQVWDITQLIAETDAAQQT